MPIIKELDERGFYLQWGDAVAPWEKGVAANIVIYKNETGDNEDWGVLAFYDVIAERQRRISIIEQPQISTDEITCLTDLNQKLHLTFITPQIWENSVKELFATTK